MDENSVTAAVLQDSGSKKKILIIEDDTVLAKMYSQKLSAGGYEVLLAGDGGEGLDIVKKNGVDLVLTDIMLPRVSGIEFVEKFKKIRKYKNTPVIAWSNLMDPQEKETVLGLGVSEYLAKGQVSLDQIAETVKKYI